MTEEAEPKKKRGTKVYPVVNASSLYIDDPKSSTKTYDITSLESMTVSESKSSSQNKADGKQSSFLSQYANLYSFADRTDYQLMAVGLFCALLQATIPPFVWLVMGNFVTMSINREEYRSANASILNGTSSNPLDEQFAKSATPAFYVMLAMSITMFFAAFFQRLAWEISAIRQVFRIKTAYVRKLLHMDVAWLESRQSGQVAHMLHEHADSIYNAIADHLPMVIFIITYLLVNIGLCLYTQWDVTLLMCTSIPLLIMSRILFSKWFARTLDGEARLQTKITNLVSETFNCIRTVIAFAAQKQTINKFERISLESNRLTESRLRSSTVYDSLTQILLTELVFTTALCYGIWKVGDTSPGELCSLAINMLYMCVTSISIGFHLNGAGVAKVNAAQMGEIFRESPEIEADSSLYMKTIAIPSNYRRASMKYQGKGTIKFENIKFAYPSRPETLVLKGVTFSVEAGERIAIVGPSGSGKSTLTALLLRFYNPSSGEITLDGEKLNQMNPDELRAQMSLVSQEPVLFDGTIADNIRYGRLDATQQEINAAARKVGAWDFISKLPMGMQTRVGDRGLQLSGGQKQRVAIARAVIRRPTVLLFDEATSALDNKHEDEVCHAIDLASEGLSTITIAHRLSTVKNSDRIIVIEDGQIVEQGPPEELLAVEGGKFKRMWSDQGLDRPDVPVIAQKPSLTAHFSLGPADLVPVFSEDDQRRAWARSSLGQTKKLGKSYSCSLHQSREKLALPVSVLTKKKSERLDYKYSNVGVFETVDVAEVSPYDMVDELELPGKRTNWRAVWGLIKGYRSGWSLLAGAIPTTIVRAFFYLLICFQVASVLELSVVPAEERPQQIFIVAAIYCALIIVKTIFEALGRLFIALYGHGFACYMRSEMFRQVLRHGCAFFDEERNAPGRLVHKIITDSATLNKILEQKLDLLIPAVVCSIFSVCVALVINWKMALLCGFQFPAYFIIRVLQIKEGSKRQRQMVEEESKAAAMASVVLSNMTTIKAYNLQEHFYEVFTDALKPLAKAMERQSYVSAFVFACQYSFTYILIAITLHFGEVMMLANEINVFDYMRVVLLTQFGANFFSQLIASVTDLSKARAAAESVMGILKENPTDTDNLSEEGLRPKIEGNLQLDNVHFRYPARPIVPILKGLEIKVKAGEHIGIVGPSGSGKSSALNLFQRLYSPTDGQVIVDKTSIKQINPAYLRRHIVSVGQEPTLFSFTIKENIAYGLLDSESTMDKITQAAKAANIHDFIMSLPQAYDTEVGEFGAQLSGGQKQRIAIARALIRKPAVLLLDEATSAIDSYTEKAVRDAFVKNKDCTMIKVAHRLSTIRSCDRIYVLVEGQVVEAGTHEELMGQQGIYREMVLMS